LPASQNEILEKRCFRCFNPEAAFSLPLRNFQFRVSDPPLPPTMAYGAGGASVGLAVGGNVAEATFSSCPRPLNDEDWVWTLSLHCFFAGSCGRRGGTWFAVAQNWV